MPFHHQEEGVGESSVGAAEPEQGSRNEGVGGKQEAEMPADTAECDRVNSAIAGRNRDQGLPLSKIHHEPNHEDPAQRLPGQSQADVRCHQVQQV